MWGEELTSEQEPLEQEFSKGWEPMVEQSSAPACRGAGRAMSSLPNAVYTAEGLRGRMGTPKVGQKELKEEGAGPYAPGTVPCCSLGFSGAANALNDQL
jgi:hypothetical protein